MVPLYKSFYEQVFFLEQGSTRVHKNVPQASEALQPYFKEGRGIQGSVVAFLKSFAVKEFLFLQVV
jgi:hypothetical protein